MNWFTFVTSEEQVLENNSLQLNLFLYVNMKFTLLIFIFYCLKKSAKTVKNTYDPILEHSIDKRQVNSIPLVFPYGATSKLIIGFTYPINNIEPMNLVFSANLQYQYQHFQNISELSRYYFIKQVSREQRDVELKSRKDERLVFYQSFENLMNMKGFNGYECVLRAICEAAQYPVEQEGLFGELIHILLTPDYGHPSQEDPDSPWGQEMEPYTSAAIAGRQMFSCEFIYRACPQEQAVMDFISVLRHE